jgi:hypothetical protein
VIGKFLERRADAAGVDDQDALVAVSPRHGAINSAVRRSPNNRNTLRSKELSH